MNLTTYAAKRHHSWAHHPRELKNELRSLQKLYAQFLNAWEKTQTEKVYVRRRSDTLKLCYISPKDIRRVSKICSMGPFSMKPTTKSSS